MENATQYETQYYENDTTDEIRHEENRSEDISPLQASCQKQCYDKGKNIDQDTRYDRKEHGVPECMGEGIVNENVFIILESYELHIADGCELAEG